MRFARLSTTAEDFKQNRKLIWTGIGSSGYIKRHKNPPRKSLKWLSKKHQEEVYNITVWIKLLYAWWNDYKFQLYLETDWIFSRDCYVRKNLSHVIQEMFQY